MCLIFKTFPEGDWPGSENGGQNSVHWGFLCMWSLWQRERLRQEQNARSSGGPLQASVAVEAGLRRPDVASEQIYVKAISQRCTDFIHISDPKELNMVIEKVN